jgi:tyrosyl-tRNA synthetase
MAIPNHAFTEGSGASSLTSPPSMTAAILRNLATVQPASELEPRLTEGKPLRVKLGVDPTAPAVTLGWAVVLRKLRDFQDAGHTAVLIIGDFTAQVGDPSGRNEVRRRLSAGEVEGYADKLLSQFDRILAPDRLEIRYNSEWLGALDMAALLDLTAKATVAQLLERGDFAKRFEEGNPISLMEFLYPMMQGYDSVAVEADIELGGTDQLWNLMMGRAIQARYGQRPQVAVTVPLLVGTDGVNKMSQSLDNYIGVTDRPEDMFGKVMSIPDSLLQDWFLLAAWADPAEVDEIGRGLADGALHPAAVKRDLAARIVSLYWGEEEAAGARAAFDRTFKDHRPPEEVDEAVLPPGDPVYLPTLLRDLGLAPSSNEAKRLIAQMAVSLDGLPVTGEEVARDAVLGSILRVGKRRFVRLTAGDGRS